MRASGLVEALYGPLADEQRPPLKIPLGGKERVLEPIDGGFHVKDLPDGRCVDVLRMIFNWRVVRSDQVHMFLDRGWCYQGTGIQTLLVACLAAVEWDGADDTDPGHGWIKRAM